MPVDGLNAVFSALSDPTRREILSRLSRGDATVSQLAEPFEISLPAVSRHLRVLQAAGLITQDRQAQWRRTSLRAAPLREAATWLDQLSRVWDERFDRLDAHLAKITQQVVPRPQPSSRPPRTPRARSTAQTMKETMTDD